MADHQADRKVDDKILQVTAYDRAASWLVSVLILTGSTVAVLALLWWAYRPPPNYPHPLIQLPPGGGEQDVAADGELESPNVEELTGMPAVDMLSSVQAALGSDAIQQASTLSVAGIGGKPGLGPGNDLNRPPGGPPVLPRWERWEIRYLAQNVDSYARQLDFFEIELGAVGGGQPQVDYASGFTQSSPNRRSGKGRDEQRLYLTWQKGTLQKWDRELLERAGVETKKRIVLQFLPAEVEAQLAQLESAEAQDKPIEMIRKTVFEVRRKGAGYEFVVLAQRYR